MCYECNAQGTSTIAKYKFYGKPMCLQHFFVAKHKLASYNHYAYVRSYDHHIPIKAVLKECIL